MDLLEIRKKAKEAQAAKAAAEGPKPVERPTPVEQSQSLEPTLLELPVPKPAPSHVRDKKGRKRAAKKEVKSAAVVEASRPAEMTVIEDAVLEADNDIPAPTVDMETAPPEQVETETNIQDAQEKPETVPAPVDSARKVESAAHTESSGRMELLAFMLADEEYALRMEEAREIIRWRKPTKVPRAPEYVVGIISLRGIILPVFDVKKRLGLGELVPSRFTRIIVVSEGGSLCGMAVDRITGVASVPEEGIEPPPAVLGGNEAEYLEGVKRAGERLLILVKASRALAAA